METFNGQSFEISAVVKIFPMENPWVYVEVPEEITQICSHLSDRGFAPVHITLGNSNWDSSLMPLGDGKQFIALKKAIRKAEGIEVGDTVKMSFVLRSR